MTIGKTYQIMLLCLLVLTIYFPTLTAEVCLVDDQEMLTSIFNSGPLHLKSLFLPQSEQGGYYRPLIGLSYYLDRALWGLDVRSMHLDNILMHLVNVLIVFYLVRLVVQGRGSRLGISLPLVAAAIFGLHPIATESVNWISGRTDLMAGNFILSSTAMLLLYRSSHQVRYLLLAAVFALLGVLAKETSFGMVLASWFIIYGSKQHNLPANDVEDAPTNSSRSRWLTGLPFLCCVFALMMIEILYIGNYWLVLGICLCYYIALLFEHHGFRNSTSYCMKRVLFMGTGVVMTWVLYTLLRNLVYRSDVGKIGQTIKLMVLDMNYTISLFLGAVGFYFKKFLLPAPLNFYILEVDPLYDFLGIFLLLICFHLLSRLRLSGAFFIAGFCMLLPALPFTFGTIAWTGYAERYVYLSAAFWVVSSVIFIDEYTSRHPKAIVAFVATGTAILVFFGWHTFDRNLVWQRNVTLLEDTVAQSPKARRLRDMYMYALYMAGDIPGAKHQYNIAASLHSVRYDESADLVMAGILTREGRLGEALALYESVVKRTNGLSLNALKRTLQHLEIMFSREDDRVRLSQYLSRIKEITRQIGQLSVNPMVHYQLGQKALAIDDKQLALDYFIRAHNAFSNASPYKDFSERLIKRLELETP